MEDGRKAFICVALFTMLGGKKNRGRGFAPFCFSETVNLRVVVSCHKRFGQVCVKCLRGCLLKCGCSGWTMRSECTHSLCAFVLLARLPHSEVQVLGTAGGRADAMIHTTPPPPFLAFTLSSPLLLPGADV